MIPRIFNPDYCDYHYHVDYLVSDVNTILTQLTQMLVTDPATAHKWVENPAGTFENPSGHIKLAFSRTAANRLGMIAYNRTGNAICNRELQIASGAPYYPVRYYTGTYYCCIDSPRATTEFLSAWVVDPYPDTYSDELPERAFANAYRSSAGAADGVGNFATLIGWDFVSWNALNRLGRFYDFGAAGSPSKNRSVVLRNMFQDVLVLQQMQTTYYWAGRLCQALIGNADTPPGHEKVVPITDGTMATFEATSWADATPNYRLYLRKA